MINKPSKIDPVDGLLDYLNVIKPLHCNLIEVILQYVYTADINVSITEDLVMSVGLIFPHNPNSLLRQHSYDINGYGNQQGWPVTVENPLVAHPLDTSVNIKTTGVT